MHVIVKFSTSKVRMCNFKYTYHNKFVFQFQFSFNVFPDIPRPFNTQYKCFSVSMFPGNERQDVERGGKSKNDFSTQYVLFIFQKIPSMSYLFILNSYYATISS